MPIIVTISAVPSEAEPCTCEPIQSQPSGTPTQRNRQPASISRTSAALAGPLHELPDPDPHAAEISLHAPALSGA